MPYCTSCRHSVSAEDHYCSNCGYELRVSTSGKLGLSVGVTNVQISDSTESPWYDETCPVGSDIKIKVSRETGQVACYRFREGTCSVTASKCSFERR